MRSESLLGPTARAAIETEPISVDRALILDSCAIFGEVT